MADTALWSRQILIEIEDMPKAWDIPTRLVKRKIYGQEMLSKSTLDVGVLMMS